MDRIFKICLVVAQFVMNCCSNRIAIPLSSFSNPYLQNSAVLARLTTLGLKNSDCVQVATDNNSPSIHSLNTNTIPILLRKMQHLEQQNIFEFDVNEHQQHVSLSLLNYRLCCVMFLFPNSSESVDRLLKASSNATSTNHKRFYPHTRIVVFGLGKPKWNHAMALYIRKNALHVLWMSKDGLEMFAMNRRGVVRETEVIGHRMDPSVGLLPSFNEKDNLLISSFNCIPNVIYHFDEHNNVTRMNGVHIEIMKEISHYWNLQFVPPLTSPPVWDVIAQQLVRDGKSDVALCSTYQRLDNYENFDLSQYFDNNCGTFLVPLPIIASSALTPYLPFDGGVWLAIFLSLIASAITVTALTDKEEGNEQGKHNELPKRFKLNFIRKRRNEIRNKVTKKRKEQSDLVKAYLDLIGIATGHGVQRFPEHVTGKTVILCWFITTLLLGVGYSTGYTSLQSSPIYNKPVDSANDFVNEGLTWTSTYNNGEYDDFLLFKDPAVLKMHAQKIIDSDPLEQADKLLNDQRHGVYVDVTYDSYLAYLEPLFQSSGDQINLRRMKTCFIRFYKTLALQKHSPYTEFINDKLLRFREGGFFVKWYKDLRLPNQRKMDVIFRQSLNVKNADHIPRPLVLYTTLGSFYLLFIGLGGSLLVFLYELKSKSTIGISMNSDQLHKFEIP